MRPSGGTAFIEQRHLRAISFLDSGMQPGEIAKRLGMFDVALVEREFGEIGVVLTDYADNGAILREVIIDLNLPVSIAGYFVEQDLLFMVCREPFDSRSTTINHI